MLIPPAPHWFKSSYSGGSGTECLECARTSEGTLVRDSKAPNGPIITFGRVAWQKFVSQLGRQTWETNHQGEARVARHPNGECSWKTLRISANATTPWP